MKSKISNTPKISFKIRFNPSLATDQENDAMGNIISLLEMAVTLKQYNDEDGTIVLTSGGWDYIEGEDKEFADSLRIFNIFNSFRSDCVAYCAMIKDQFGLTTSIGISQKVRNVLGSPHNAHKKKRKIISAKGA